MKPSEPIKVIGPCGETYKFLSEYSGVLMQCPKCRKVYRVPDMASETPIKRYLMKREGLQAQVEELSAAPIWSRTYTIDQEFWSYIESYKICEKGQQKTIVIADRPNRYFNVLIYACLIVVVFIVTLFARLTGTGNLAAIALVGAFGATVAVLIALRFKFGKRNITFFTSEARTEVAFSVKDLNQLEFPYARFRVIDAEGRVLGELRKSWIGDIFRSPWTVTDHAGKKILFVREESFALSLLRRFFLTKLWWFRTNYVLLDPETDDLCGEFNRVPTIEDNYILDLSANGKEMDIRLLWTLGVLLDTVERR